MANDARHGNANDARHGMENRVVDHSVLRAYRLHHRLAVLLRRRVQRLSEPRDFPSSAAGILRTPGSRVGHDVDEMGATLVNAAGGGP